MHNLGHTRSDRQPTHLLQTPDTFVAMPLPGFDSVTVIVHAAPAIGAAFTQYTAEFEPGGSLGPAHGQRFLYVLEGAVSVDAGRQDAYAGPGGYAHLPPNQLHTVKASTRSRVAVIEKPAVLLADEAPAPALFGNEDEAGLAAPWRRQRAAGKAVAALPPPGLDYAVNTMHLPARRGAGPGGNPRHGARAADARRRRHLPPGKFLVSGADGRFYLDGALLPAMVRRSGQDAGQVS